MEAFDFSSPNQRRWTFALAALYPGFWLWGLLTRMSGPPEIRFASLAAAPLMLASAIAVFAVMREEGTGTPPKRVRRYVLYGVWSWLVPYCLISLSLVLAFPYMWPAFALLIVPALTFLTLRVSREHFLLTILLSLLATVVYSVTSIEGELAARLKIVIPLVVTAGPFWTLAAYLGLIENTVQAHRSRHEGSREIRSMMIASIVGVLLFVALIASWILIAVSGTQLSMSARESRPASLRILSSLGIVIAIYALAIYVPFSSVVGSVLSHGQGVCDESIRRFVTPGRIARHDDLGIQPETQRVFALTHERFPFPGVHDRHGVSKWTALRDRYTVHAIGLKDDDPGWQIVPHIEDHPLQVMASLVWRDKLLLWGGYPNGPGGPADVHFVLDPSGTSRWVGGRDRLKPVGLDARTNTLISIQERVTIFGGQPREEERPPQALVIEPLDDEGLPHADAAVRHSIRGLRELLADDEGGVYFVRWQGGLSSPTRSPMGYKFLEKYSIPEQRLVWSVQLNADPIVETQQEQSRLVLSEAGIRLESDHRVPIEGREREHHLKLRARIYDRASGAYLGDEIMEHQRFDPASRKEIDVAGQRYRILERGLRGECLSFERSSIADGLGMNPPRM